MLQVLAQLLVLLASDLTTGIAPAHHRERFILARGGRALQRAAQRPGTGAFGGG
jgi:hypothetical protein